MKKLILIFLVLAYCAEAQNLRTIRKRAKKTVTVSTETESTTTYFVKNGGNDALSGRSDANAWATISKVNSTSFSAGDTVSLKCGSTWEEQITVGQSGNEGTPIVFTSYGSGALPIIDGAKVYTTWIRNGNVWASPCTESVKNLFVDGVQWVKARYPNLDINPRNTTSPILGYIPVATTNEHTTVTATLINQASGYWTGATIHLRHTYAYDNETVTGYDGTTLTFTSTQFHINVADGFYLDNIKAALDTAKEYFCDEVNDSLYIYSTTSPSGHVVQGSYIDYGIYGNAISNVTVNGIEFKKQASSAINFPGTNSGITVRNCRISQAWGRGINIPNTTTKDTVQYNYIWGCNDVAIQMYYATYYDVSYDTILSSGMVQGYTDQGYSILIAAGTNGSIKYNYIDSTGYCAIYPHSNTTIYGNVIKNSVMCLGDGGAIYVSAGQDMIIRKNMIYDSWGNSKGTGLWTESSTWWTYIGGEGIYLDAYPSPMTARIVVDGNTIVRAGSRAIKIGAGDTSITVCNNNIFAGGKNSDGAHIMLCPDYNFPGYTNNKVYHNSVFDTSNTPVMQIYQLNTYDYYRPPGVIDSNWYASSQNVRFDHFTQTPSNEYFYSLADWRTFTNHEKYSRGLYRAFDGSRDSVVLFTNNTGTTTNTELTGDWRDTAGTIVSSPLSLPAYSSAFLIKDKGEGIYTYLNDTIVVDANDTESEDTYEYLGAGQIGKGASSVYQTGLRFKCEVPPGAIIDTVLIHVTFGGQTGWATDICNIQISLNAQAPIFVEGHSHTVATHLATLSTAIEWSGFTPNNDVAGTTPNLASQVQSVIDLGGYAENNYIGFCLSAKTPTTNHNFQLYDYSQSAAKAAWIHIVYHYLTLNLYFLICR